MQSTLLHHKRLDRDGFFAALFERGPDAGAVRFVCRTIALSFCP